MVAVRNEYVSAASFISLNGGNYRESEQHDMVANIDFESVVTARKMNFFHQKMIYFVNRLESKDHKYKKNGTIRKGNYEQKFLFSVRAFVPFGTDQQSMFNMSTIFF